MNKAEAILADERKFANIPLGERASPVLFDNRYPKIRDQIIAPGVAEVRDILPGHVCGQTALIMELTAFAQLCCSNASMKLMDGAQREKVTMQIFERIMFAHIQTNTQSYSRWLSTGADKFTNGLALNGTLRHAFRSLMFRLLDAFYDPSPDVVTLSDKVGTALDGWLVEQTVLAGVDVQGLRRDFVAIRECCTKVALATLPRVQQVSFR